MEFVSAFWHCECVCGLSEKAFTVKYQKWRKKHGYNFSQNKTLVAFAGIDAPPYQSGQMEVRSRSISERGSSALRRTLFSAKKLKWRWFGFLYPFCGI